MVSLATQRFVARRGRVLAGRYQLGRVIGRGGFARVYSATRLTCGSRVAVKVARDPGVPSRRLRREARLLGQLRHPGLVTALDSGAIDDGCSWMAMELLGGRHLSAAAAHVGRRRASEWVLQVCRTVGWLHARGVLHRDLSARNVIVDAGRATLIDLGLALPADPEDDATRLTEPGRVIGTLRVAAPETLRGRRADARTDVFALGTLLYRVVAGRYPYGGDEAAMVTGILHEAPPPLPRGIPDLVRDTVHRALAKAPDLRFPDARVMADALCEGLARWPHGPPAHPVPARGLSGVGVPTLHDLHRGAGLSDSDRAEAARRPGWFLLHHPFRCHGT